MNTELRLSWTCRNDNCAVTVRQMDGSAFAEPRKWEDGLCIKCRISEEGRTNGWEAGKTLAEKLRTRKADDRFSGPKPKRKSNRIYRPVMTADQQPQVEKLIRDGLSNKQVTAETGVSEHSVWRFRETLGLPDVKTLRRQAKERTATEFSAVPA
jgi:hypothetical protein